MKIRMGLCEQTESNGTYFCLVREADNYLTCRIQIVLYDRLKWIPFWMFEDFWDQDGDI